MTNMPGYLLACRSRRFSSRSTAFLGVQFLQRHLYAALHDLRLGWRVWVAVLVGCLIEPALEGGIDANAQ